MLHTHTYRERHSSVAPSVNPKPSLRRLPTAWRLSTLTTLTPHPYIKVLVYDEPLISRITPFPLDVSP